MIVESSWYAIASYGIAALVFAASTFLLLLGRGRDLRATLLVVATATSFIWALALTLVLVGGRPSPPSVVALDAIHALVWTIGLLFWVDAFRASRWLAAGAAAGACWVLFAASPWASPALFGQTANFVLVAMSVVGLLVSEQVFRNARAEQREHLKLLCIATGGIFVSDLFVYAEAALIDPRVPLFWATRGFVNAALMPLVLLAEKRQRNSKRELVVSRQVMFYTTSLLGVGLYLFAMGLVAYLLRYSNADWSYPAALAFLVIAAMLLVFILFSTAIRVKVRAFLVKHFYRNKYDYRKEWLLLTQKLGQSGDVQLLALNGLSALAQITGSRNGELWLERDAGRYDWMASLNGRVPDRPTYDTDHPMVAFLARRSWVIDSEEYAAEPDRYDSAFGDPSDSLLPKRSIVVPLDCQGRLQGFVVLENPAGAGALNFEDHDILKTAGRQVAVALAQALGLEKLAETRQFEAMNKMTTFLMHDLKNIVAQQQLLIENAVRFRSRPEFFDDAIATVRSGVERMRYVLAQLDGSRRKTAARGRTDLSKVVMEVCSHCADRLPVPSAENAQAAYIVYVEREKLVSILTHLVRNAQEATPPDGSIRITLERSGPEVICKVIDTGCGMDLPFIRDRLFKPFDSTKGERGMGIGVYQARELVQAAGGKIEVFSALNAGTTFVLHLPATDVVAQAVEA